MSEVHIHVKNEHGMIVSGSGDPNEPGVIIDHTDEAAPVVEFNDLEVRERAEQLFRCIWYNGFCDMVALGRQRHYIETIAECARELPTIVDYHQAAWVLEWQMTDRVRKLNFEFSRVTGLGKILALSEMVDPVTRERKPFLTPAMRITAENIRLAFKWYYTPEHVMFIEKGADHAG
jgi:hypothetical protein